MPRSAPIPFGQLDAVFASSQHRAMASPRIGILLVAACTALACGDRPDPPGPAVSSGDAPSAGAPSGAGSASGSLDRPQGGDGGESDDMPPRDPPGDEPVAGEADGGLVPDDDDDESDEGEPPLVGSGQTAEACTDDGGNCLIVNIAVTDVGADSCILLALDDCESSSQAGLQVRLPVSWRLGAASVTSTAEGCVPGAQFNPQTSSTIIDASGSINWNLTTRVPSEVVLDLTLEPASNALDPIRVTNSDLVAPLIECD